jgi:RsiW-degrading membrane proteinase PrsW (M82 family)
MTELQAADARADAIAESGWGRPLRVWQWENPAFWVFAVLVGNGAWVFYGVIRNGSQYPTASALGAVLVVLYTIPFALFITHVDRFGREPAGLALLAFLWGGLAATWAMALPGNGAVLSIYAKLFGVGFAASWGPPLTAPLVEETSKYVGLVLLFLLARNLVRSAYDGLLLGAFIGLGFQVFEDYSYIVNTAADNYGASEAHDAITTAVLRFGTGFWSHATYTAIAGAGFGYLIGATSRSLARRIGVAAAALLAAMVAHGCLDAVAGIGLLAIPCAVIVGTAGLTIAWRAADRRQRRWVGVLLRDEIPTGVVTADELRVLESSRRARKAYLRAIRRTEGRRTARSAGHVLDAELDLATQIAATDDPTSPAARHARAEVARVRTLANR